MNDLRRWLDKMVQRLCEGLNDFFPGQHILANAGYGMAGLPRMLILPVDRRLPSNILHMAHGNAGDMANKAHVGGGSNTESTCEFWAYCHMSGQPCVWCGGRNSVAVFDSRYSELGAAARALCPSGKTGGNAWWGCCRNPAGTAKLIAFLDCCGSGFCKNLGLSRCRNWPDAKDWCTFNIPAITMRVPAGPMEGRGAGFPTKEVTLPAQVNATTWFGDKSYYCTVVVDAGGDATCN